MKLVYMSLTGQTRRFVNKLSVDSLEVKKNDYVKLNEPFMVIIPTYAYEVTSIVDEFLDFEENYKFLKGVCGSGNRNFNELFCFSAKDMAKKYNVPLIHCFEFQGSQIDVEIINNEVNKIGKS